MFDIELRNLAKSCLKLSVTEEATILASLDLERKAEYLPTIHTINMVMNNEMLQGQLYNQNAMNTLVNSLASMPIYFLSVGSN